MEKTVIVYEDDPEFRKHLENIFITIQDEFKLLSSFQDANEVLTHLSSYKPDIIIMDIQMNSDDDGLYALNKIKTVNLNTKVMMLTTFDVDDKVFNAICLGADGYMLKTDFSSYKLPQEVIRRSLKIIFDGGAYLTPSVAKQILNVFIDQTIPEKIKNVKARFDDIFKKESTSHKKFKGMTRMQTKVLREITEGKSTAEIAKELYLSENTINTHIKAIYNILGVHSRTKAVKKALEAKWVKYSK